MYQRTAEEDLLPQPPLLHLITEAPRAISEIGLQLVAGRLLPSRSVGDGRPVLVLPGFALADSSTAALRRYLLRHGFDVHPWRLGRNRGFTDAVLRTALDRVDALLQESDEPISLVGWSLGGLIARWLAHQRPDGIGHVVTLGSPYRREGERTRFTFAFGWAAGTWGLAEDIDTVLTVLRQPLPVHSTAIFSVSDGVLNWRSCVDDESPSRENIPVRGSHCGLTHNHRVLALVADRLAAPRHVAARSAELPPLLPRWTPGRKPA